MSTDDNPATHVLSRRERQIMDVLYRHQGATASDIHRAIPDLPSYSAARAALWLLEQKGMVQHLRARGRHVYHPTTPIKAARKTALKHIVSTFFDGSLGMAAVALFESHDRKNLTEDEIATIRELLARPSASRGGKKKSK